MASYCEVCQGLYNTPHPHWRGQRSFLLPPCAALDSNPCVMESGVSPSRPSHGGSGGGRSMSWPRSTDPVHVAPHTLASAVSPRPGGARRGTYTCPSQQQRSASASAAHGAYESSRSHGGPCGASHAAPPSPAEVRPTGEEGGDGRRGRHRRSATSPTPPPPLSFRGQRWRSPTHAGYSEGTYCSLRRADGHPPQSCYLRRGEGQGCVSLAHSREDVAGCAAEEAQWGCEGGQETPPSTTSPVTPAAQADARAAPPPPHRSQLHGTPRHDKDDDGDDRHHRCDALYAAAAATAASASDAAPALLAAPAATPHTHVAPGAPPPPSRRRTTASAPPQPPQRPPPPPALPMSCARETVADLVAQIREEVSGGVAPWTVPSTSAEPPPQPPQRHRREERRRHTPRVKGVAALHRSSVSPSSSSDAGERRRRRHRHRCASASASAAVAAAAAAQKRVRSAPVRRGRRSRGRHQRSSSSSSTKTSCSTASSSSSSACLRRTVRGAEAVLRRLQDKSRAGGGGGDSRPRTPEAARRTQRRIHGATAASAPASVSASAAAVERWAAETATDRPQPTTDAAVHARGRGEAHRRSASTRGAAPPLHRSASPLSTTTERLVDAHPHAPWPPAGGHSPPERRADGPPRRTGVADTADEVHTLVAELAAEVREQQEGWRVKQEHRVERLREGLASLCAAVRKDLQRVRDEVGTVRAEATAAAVAGERRTQEVLTAAQRADALARRAAAADTSSFSVVAAVAQSTPDDQRRLAALLLPHLRPLIAAAVQEEVQQELRRHHAEQDASQRALERRLHASVADAVASLPRRAEEEDVAAAAAPLLATFSSADAFDAHLRATTRAVLLEEDDRRYGLSSENERRHERRVRQLQREWEETLHAAQAQWRSEWKAVLEREASAWTRKARAPLQQHADILQDIVTALTRDATRLQEQQEALSARLSASLRQEREMRTHEQTQLAERIDQRWRQQLPREVESACVRIGALREQRRAVLDPAGAAETWRRSGVAPMSPVATAPAAAAPASAPEELRLSVVQPAMEHMRRLLASHQELIDAAVEDRCRRAERTVEGSRHVWVQNVAEVRTKLSALRADVRGAFGELCENLNVAAPAL
ncbi:hypothetical protein NESM_000430600 [Novymonas esmeraldas]|uniref:Uncharacterized protein n=1 Tax=Novymonas esmeraldas TaxID=1808958 RepID=A0AAW0EM09_9TRYP